MACQLGILLWKEINTGHLSRLLSYLVEVQFGLYRCDSIILDVNSYIKHN